MITSTAMVLSATLETSTTAVAQTKIVLGGNMILLRILLSINIITINIIAIYIIAFNNNITWALLKDEGRLERPAIKERSQPILILPMDVNIVHCAICQVCLIYYISEYCVDLFAPKVLLEYLRPMITVSSQSHPQGLFHHLNRPRIDRPPRWQKDMKTKGQKDEKTERWKFERLNSISADPWPWRAF